MLWVSDFNSAQHSVGSAFMAIVYSDYLWTAQRNVTCSGRLFTPKRIREFATTQVRALSVSRGLSSAATFCCQLLANIGWLTVPRSGEIRS